MQGRMGEYPAPTREQRKVYEGKEGIFTGTARVAHNLGLREPAEKLANLVGGWRNCSSKI
jgi:hypothetical protein